MAKTSIRWTPSVEECPRTDHCGAPCVPPDDSTFSVPAPDANGNVSWSGPAGSVTEVSRVSGPATVSGVLSDGDFILSGRVEGAACVVFKVSSECGVAVWTFEIPAPCKLPCPTQDIALSVDESGEVTASVPLNSTGATVVNSTGLGEATVRAVGSLLNIVGKVDPGPWSVTLKSDCGQCVVKGTIAAPPPAPVCLPLRLLRIEGSAEGTIGEPMNVCYVFAGTPPVELVTFDALPPGLGIQITSSGEETRVCITGTPEVDKCADEESLCKTGKVTIRNCAGTFEFSPKFYIAPPGPPPLTFCAGFALVEDIPPPGPGLTGYKISAVGFPPNSKLYVTAPGGVINNPNEGIDKVVIHLNTLGEGSGEIHVLSSGSGCNHYSLVLNHPTCGVVANRVVVTPPIAYGNECDDTGGAG